MHIVVPRGPHTQADVEAALTEHDFSVVQWWPVTLVTCDLHGSECQARVAHEQARDALYAAGINSQRHEGPALVVEPCRTAESTVCGV